MSLVGVSSTTCRSAFQTERFGQWTKGRSCDTFGLTGLLLVTKDDVKDIHNLKIWLAVNGEKGQDGPTATMIDKPVFLVSYLSQFMSLHLGDITSTGTLAWRYCSSARS